MIFFYKISSSLIYKGAGAKNRNFGAGSDKLFLSQLLGSGFTTLVPTIPRTARISPSCPSLRHYFWTFQKISATVGVSVINSPFFTVYPRSIIRTN
jgi:hypothetical protein